MQVYFNYCFSPFSSTALVLITYNRVSVCTQVAKPETLDHLDIFVYCYFLNSCFCNSWKYNQIRGSIYYVSRISSFLSISDHSAPFTYTYLECLLGVKMRGHKMAEIWEWLLIRSTAGQYQDRPEVVLFCFRIPRYAAYFDFSKQNTTVQVV